MQSLICLGWPKTKRSFREFAVNSDFADAASRALARRGRDGR
jgi:hypothetical protein